MVCLDGLLAQATDQVCAQTEWLQINVASVQLPDKSSCLESSVQLCMLWLSQNPGDLSQAKPWSPRSRWTSATWVRVNCAQHGHVHHPNDGTRATLTHTQMAQSSRLTDWHFMIYSTISTMCMTTSIHHYISNSCLYNNHTTNNDAMHHALYSSQMHC